ncbi:hypothetical protein RAM80_24960 [Pseudomonas sp. App30]|uniref:hypothetical protein n=1 Tax=Pseudomonas sp. App30 TaxID=3068990 RepID=UPI003A7FF989
MTSIARDDFGNAAPDSFFNEYSIRRKSFLILKLLILIWLVIWLLILILAPLSARADWRRRPGGSPQGPSAQPKETAARPLC